MLRRIKLVMHVLEPLCPHLVRHRLWSSTQERIVIDVKLRRVHGVYSGRGVLVVDSVHLMERLWVSGTCFPELERGRRRG